MTLAASSAFTITATTLATGAARESNAIDNSTNQYLDALVFVQATLATGTPATGAQVNVYAYGSEDGTNYGDNVTGSDAAVTLRSPTNLRLIGVTSTPTAGALNYKGHPMSVAQAFGGVLPRKWGIVIENQSGFAFTACSASWTGIY